jgi:hypothetical protein
VEYPNSTGEKALNTFSPSDNFPLYTDPVKIRIYTAAHCLDYSLNEEVTLALFNAQNRNLPAFGNAFLNIEIKIPELESVKRLRTSLLTKISGSFTEDMAKKIILAFAPRTRNLEAVFGTVSLGGTPSAKNRCIMKPEQTGGDQYSCATYNDTAVLDVEFEQPPDEKTLSVLRELRQQQTNLTKAAQRNSTIYGYLTDTVFRTVDYLLPANPPMSDFSPCYTGADRTQTKISVFKPVPSAETDLSKKCVDFPISTIRQFEYFNYSVRERLKTFSRLNMIAAVPALTLPDLALNTCVANPSNPACAAKTEVETTLSETAGGVSMNDASVSNFLSATSPYGVAMTRLDNILAAWNILLTIPAPTDPLDLNYASDLLLIKILNPLWNTFFQSNFIVQKNTDNTLAAADDAILKRAFMTLPIKNIIGTDAIPDTGELPVLMESWNATGADFRTGKFLRLFTNDSILSTFATQFVQTITFPHVEDFLVRPKTLPTQIKLQKGDSGSVFALDGIPLFALSTVNGEPTSGGAAVAAIPVAGEDTDDSLPPNTQVAGGSGGIPTAGKSAACK